MTLPYTPPIYPSGANSIEARVKALEVAQHYDVQRQQQIIDMIEASELQQAEDMRVLHERISNLSRKRDADREHMEAAKNKLLLYLVGALFSAVSALALMVVKMKAPGLLP